MRPTLKALYGVLACTFWTGYASAQTPTFNSSEVCKAGIGMIMGRDVATIKSKIIENEVILDYARPADGKKFKYTCTLPSGTNRIFWAAWIDGEWGRWRDTPADGELTYREENNELVITEVMPGSTPHSKHYTKSNF